jgi:hypothetical protein
VSKTGDRLHPTVFSTRMLTLTKAFIVEISETKSKNSSKEDEGKNCIVKVIR